MSSVFCNVGTESLCMLFRWVVCLKDLKYRTHLLQWGNKLSHTVLWWWQDTQLCPWYIDCSQEHQLAQYCCSDYQRILCEQCGNLVCLLTYLLADSGGESHAARTKTLFCTLQEVWDPLPTLYLNTTPCKSRPYSGHMSSTLHIQMVQRLQLQFYVLPMIGAMDARNM